MKTTMAEVCELAHLLTIAECKRRKIKVEKQVTKDETCYTAKGQIVFDNYYNLITETLKV